MNIGIIGCGGVGGYIGAKIIKSTDNRVDMSARGAHLKAIKENDLTIIDEDATFKVDKSHVNKTLSLDTHYDIILFCTKTYDLRSACDENREFIDEDTILLSLNNGVDNDLVLKNEFPSNPVAKGCIYILSNIIKPSVIKKYGGVFNIFMGMDENEKLEEFSNVLKRSDLRHEISDDIDFQIWRKYLLISAFASLTTYYDTSMGDIVKNHKKELETLLDEIILIANAKGIKLTEKEKQSVIQRARKIPFESTTSMLLDFRAGKKMELEALSGYIVKEAGKLGIKTPLMQKIYEKLS